VAIFVVDMRELHALDRAALLRKCRHLSDEWERRGRPDEAAMPQYMVIARAALQSELERRGEQLSFF